MEQDAGSRFDECFPDHATVFHRDQEFRVEGSFRRTDLIGSTAAVFGEAGHVDYAAAKAGISYGMLQTLKNEISQLTRSGRVNAVCPGWVMTPMAEKFAEDRESKARALQTIPMQKFGQPEDIAASAVFLSSPRLSGHLTGQLLVASGGMEGRVLYPPGE